MGLTSHLSNAYDAFSSLCASFSLLLSPMTMTPTNQTTTVQGPGYFLVRTFLYVLKYTLIESFDFCLVESYLIESQYFQHFFRRFPLKNFPSFNFLISNMLAVRYIFDYSFNIIRMRHPTVPVRAPPDPVRVLYSGSNDTIEQVPYIVYLDGHVPKMYDLWNLNAQGVCEVHPFAQV